MSKHTPKDKAVKAVKKPASNAPLNDEEWVELEKIICSTGDSNYDLFNAAREVRRLRNELSSAEDELNRATQANQEVCRKLAPLLQRMPKAY